MERKLFVSATYTTMETFAYFRKDDLNDCIYEGSVYPIEYHSEDLFFFQAQGSSSTVHLKEPNKDIVKWFDFSVRWRGDWDVRIYITERELRDIEIQAIIKIFNQLADFLKERIKLENPDYKYD